MEITSYKTGILIAGTIVFVIATILSPTDLSFAQTASSPSITTTTTPQTAAQRVAVGQGSTETVQYYTYTPQSIEINVGESGSALLNSLISTQLLLSEIPTFNLT